MSHHLTSQIIRPTWKPFICQIEHLNGLLEVSADTIVFVINNCSNSLRISLILPVCSLLGCCPFASCCVALLLSPIPWACGSLATIAASYQFDPLHLILLCETTLAFECPCTSLTSRVNAQFDNFSFLLPLIIDRNSTNNFPASDLSSQLWRK